MWLLALVTQSDFVYVPISGYYNVDGMGSVGAGANFDTGGYAFPVDYVPTGTLLQNPRTGTYFDIPADAGYDCWGPSTTTNTTLDVTDARYASLHIMVSAFGGNKVLKIRAVYTDGSSSAYSFTVPDWCSHYYEGDPVVMCPFRLAGSGVDESEVPIIWEVWSYLDWQKELDKLIVEATPDNGGIRIFAISLFKAPSFSSTVTKIDLTPYYNIDGIAESATDAGDFDGVGYAFPDDSEDVFPVGNVSSLKAEYYIPPDRTSGTLTNFMEPQGQVINVPEDYYRSAYILASGVLGGDTVSITFVKSDGSTEVWNVFVPDWCGSGGSVFVRFSKRYDTNADAVDNHAPAIYELYTLIDNSTKVTEIRFGSSSKVRILALSLSTDVPFTKTNYEFLSGIGSGNEAGDIVKLYYHAQIAYMMPVSSTAISQFRTDYNSALDVINPGDYGTASFEQELEQAKLNIYSAMDHVKNELISSSYGSYRIFLFPHSHIDAVWMWRWTSTVEKVRSTWSMNLDRMDRESDYIYMHSTPMYYKWMKEYYPDIFEGVKNYVQSGRWFPLDGLFVEPDSNLPSGEGYVRTRLYGYWLYRQLFGEAVADQAKRVVWMPDCFGFAASFPQIFAKSGAQVFFTTKLMWGGFYTNHWNFNVVRWKSPDGSEILVHQGIENYNYGLTEPNRVIRNMPSFEERNRYTVNQNEVFSLKDYPTYQDKSNTAVYQSSGLKTTAYMFGVGDGGGGPVEDEYWRAHVLAYLGDNKLVKISSPLDFLQTLVADAGGNYDNIPVWKDELYLEYHRGTYTHASPIKHWIRTLENTLSWSESASLASYLFAGADFPLSSFSDWWSVLAFNYFHDITPGSGIAEAYTDCVNQMKETYQEAEAQGESALEELSSYVKTDVVDSSSGAIFVYNPLSWSRTEPVWVEWNQDNYARVYDEQGREIPVQYVEENGKRYLVFIAQNIPSMGYKVYNYKLYVGDYPPSGFSESNPGYDSQLYVDGTTLKNSYYDVTVNTTTGAGSNSIITAIFDKQLSKDVIPAGESVSLKVFGEAVTEWPAWNLDPGYEANDWTGNLELVSVSTTMDGPVVKEKTFYFTYYRSSTTDATKWPVDPRASTLKVRVRLYANVKRVDLKFEWSWYGYNTLVKVRFPMNLSSGGTPNAYAEIPYGVYERPCVPSNDAEAARWEFPAGKWITLFDSTNGFGVTVSNYAKCGWDLKECYSGVGVDSGVRVLRASLIHYPDDHMNPYTNSGGDNYYQDPSHQWEEENQQAVFSINSYSGSAWTDSLSWRRGFELNEPLVGIIVPSHDGVLPTSTSLFAVNSPKVVVGAIKLAEDGSGDVILRLFNFSPDNITDCEVKLPFKVANARESDLLETEDWSQVAYENSDTWALLTGLNFTSYEIKTLRVTPWIGVSITSPTKGQALDGVVQVTGFVSGVGKISGQVLIEKDGKTYTLGTFSTRSFNITADVSSIPNGWALLKMKVNGYVQSLPVYVGNGYYSAFEYVNPSWNCDAWGYSGASGDSNIDGLGYGLLADYLPAEGSLWVPTDSNVPYFVGKLSGSSYNALNITSDGTIATLSSRYYRAGILLTSVSGSSQFTLRFNYSDGTYTDVSVVLPDWCDSTYISEASVTFQRRDGDSLYDAHACGVSEYTVDLDPSKTLSSVEVLSYTGPGKAVLLGLTLEKVPEVSGYYPSGSSAEYGGGVWIRFSAPVFADRFLVEPDHSSEYVLPVSYEEDFCKASGESTRLIEPSESYTVTFQNCRTATGRKLDDFSWSFSTASADTFAYLETPQGNGFYRTLEVRGAVLGTTLKAFSVVLDGETVLTSQKPTHYAVIYSGEIEEGVHTVELVAIGSETIRITRKFTVDRTPASLKRVLNNGKEVGDGDIASTGEVSLVLFDGISGINASGVKVKINGKLTAGRYSVEGGDLIYTVPLEQTGKVLFEVEAADVAGNVVTYKFTLSVNTVQEQEVTYLMPFPNPASEKTYINYVLGADADEVLIKIFDSSGRKVKVIKGDCGAGYHSVLWNLDNSAGLDVANGIYIVKVEAKFGGRKIFAKSKILVMR